MRWPEDGIPDNPAAWLTTTAYRRALDVLRRRRVEGQKLQEVAAMVPELESAIAQEVSEERLVTLRRDLESIRKAALAYKNTLNASSVG